MMKKNIISPCIVFILLTALSTQPLTAEDILKILEGYGRDSIATFSAQNGQAEAAQVFNLLLEQDGKITSEKAEQYLKTTESPVMKAYLCVMLADYTFVNNGYDSGLRYLKRAVDEYDPIRNDSYYRLVLSRAQKNITESPGKTDEGKTSVLVNSAPAAIKKAPEIQIVSSDNATPAEVINPAQTEPAPMEEAIDETSPAPTVISEADKTAPEQDKPINFRIQVGAFSVKENAERKQQYFEKNGYPVEVEAREGSSGYLYLVRIGEYESYDEAKDALSDMKTAHPSEDGIVVKVAKK